MFDNFPSGEYKVLVIDPPWDLGWGKLSSKRGLWRGYGDMPYETLSIEEIKTLPIHQAMADDCFVFLWTTQAKIRDAFDICDYWNLTYACVITWHKNHGPNAPNRPCYNSEFVIMAKYGNPTLISVRGMYACFSAPNRGHSVKPSEFYNMVSHCTEGPRLDVFSRRLIPGFDVWGDQAPDKTMEGIQHKMWED